MTYGVVALYGAKMELSEKLKTLWARLVQISMWGAYAGRDKITLPHLALSEKLREPETIH